jgi:hypothetical protein
MKEERAGEELIFWEDLRRVEPTKSGDRSFAVQAKFNNPGRSLLPTSYVSQVLAHGVNHFQKLLRISNTEGLSNPSYGNEHIATTSPGTIALLITILRAAAQRLDRQYLIRHRYNETNEWNDTE